MNYNESQGDEGANVTYNEPQQATACHNELWQGTTDLDKNTITQGSTLSQNDSQ